MAFVWPRPTAPEEVDEKPWTGAQDGGSHHEPEEADEAVTGMSFGFHPWRADDVGVFSFSGPPNSIPGPRQEHPRRALTENTGPTTATPARLFWPAGPSPCARSSSSSDISVHQFSPSPTSPLVATRTSSPLSATDSNDTCGSCGTTSLADLVASTTRTMDYINSALALPGAAVAMAKHTAGTVWRAGTSKTAARTLLTTALFGVVSTVLFGVAVGAYWVFYQQFMPDQVVRVPVHLQYGYATNPYGIVDLTHASLGDYQDYDITVTLRLPRSPTNLARGNFMLALHLLDDKRVPSSTVPVPEPVDVLVGRHVLHTSTRPAIVPYTDPLVSLASRLLFLGYHIVVPYHAETIELAVPLVERLEFRPGTMRPTALVVDVQAGQDLHVYSADVTITAQLSGLRWFMYSWWATAFVLFTGAFWGCEVFFLGLSFLVLSLVLGEEGSITGPTNTNTVKDEQGATVARRDGGVKEEEDVPMTFPTTSGQQPLRYDPMPSHTSGLDVAAPDSRADQRGGEADDEDEDEEDERARDSGIGTSYSERDSSTLRRRTSRGRMGH